MVRVLGWERKSGNYEGNAYDNCVLHCVTDEKSAGWVAGDLTFTVKIKTADFPLVFDKTIKPGDSVFIQYNRYGRVELVVPAEDNPDVLKPKA